MVHITKGSPVPAAVRENRQESPTPALGKATRLIKSLQEPFRKEGSSYRLTDTCMYLILHLAHGGASGRGSLQRDATFASKATVRSFCT